MRTVGERGILEGLRPSDHVCWHVPNGAEFERLGKAFLDEAAFTGERAFVFGPQADIDDSPLTKGSVRKVDPLVALLGGGPLVPEAIFEAFRTRTETARAEGYTGIRVLADMRWLLPTSTEAGAVVGFELLLDEIVSQLDATVVCAYRGDAFAAPDVEAIGCVHPIWMGERSDRALFRLSYAGDDTWDLAGEIDMSNADAFGHALSVLAGSRSSVRLSLGDLRFIDLSGVRAIASVAGAAPETRFLLVRPPATLRRCWSALGCSELAPGVVLA